MWIALSLICALSLAGSDALTKSVLKRPVNPATVGWLRVAISAPFTLLILLFIDIPALDNTFWTVLIVALPFEVLAMVLYAKALKASPLSLTLPFLSLTPAFLLIAGRLALGENIPARGIAGIVLITIGGYALNFSHNRYGWLGPVRAIAREPGSVMMIFVAIIFSVTATLLKIGIEHSSAMFYSSIYYSAVSIAALPVAGLSGLKDLQRREYPGLLAAGMLMALMLVTNMAALELAKVAYVISIKRTSLLFGVVLGWLVFRETDISERMTGAAMMMAGFVLVIISSGP